MKDTRRGPNGRKHDDRAGVPADEVRRFFSELGIRETGLGTRKLARHRIRRALLGNHGRDDSRQVTVHFRCHLNRLGALREAREMRPALLLSEVRLG